MRELTEPRYADKEPQLCSYGEAIRFHALRQPGATALVAGDEQLSWAQLESLANRLARAFALRGAGHGDLISLALGNEALCVAAVIACWKLGAVPHMLPYRLPAPEQAAILAVARPRLLVGGSAPPEDTVAHLPAPAREAAGLDDGPLPEQVSPWCRAMCSGGSTGTPKVIVDHTPARCDPRAAIYTVEPGSTTLVPGPLYHSGPFLNGFWTLLGGGCLVLMGRFEAEATLQLIDRHRPDYIGLVPTMMLRIWRLPAATRARYDLSSLRRVVSSGAPCPAWLMRSWIEWLGPERMFEAYGASERIGGTLISGVEWLAHPGSVGRPTLGRQIQVLGEDGRVLPAGEVGLIHMKAATGEPPGFHYLGAVPEQNSEGWVTLGDMGYFDSDGYLYVTDRKADMIVSGGVNIFPAEVEAAVEACAGVLSCAVIGLPDEDLGQRVHAIVQAEETFTEAGLREFLDQRLSAAKHPRSIERVAYPLRDDAGKLRRRQLRDERVAR